MFHLLSLTQTKISTKVLPKTLTLQQLHLFLTHLQKAFQMLSRNWLSRPFIPFTLGHMQFFTFTHCLLLFPPFDVLQPPATSFCLFWCSSFSNETSHCHPESTLCLLSLNDPLCLSPLHSSPCSRLPRETPVLLHKQIVCSISLIVIFQASSEIQDGNCLIHCSLLT